MQRHADLDKLYEICEAIERRDGKGTLPSVRRDSPEWKAWRGWFIERGLKMLWSDAQPGERMMTVATDYPPLDIEETHQRLVRRSRKAPDLDA